MNLRTEGYIIPLEICYDPKDNPYNLETGKIYSIKMKDGQIFTGKFARVEKLGVIVRYKFISMTTISLRVAHTEFEVIGKGTVDPKRYE